MSTEHMPNVPEADTDEWQPQLTTREQYLSWVGVLASNAVHSAVGSALDAQARNTQEETEQPEYRLEHEVELEVDDKLNVLIDEQNRCDITWKILQRTHTPPTERVMGQTDSNVGKTATIRSLATDVLEQDVFAVAVQKLQTAREENPNLDGSAGVPIDTVSTTNDPSQAVLNDRATQ